MSANSHLLSSHHPLTAAMLAFVAGFGLHGIDHLRRGMEASPPAVMVGGMSQGLFVLIVLVLVLGRHRWAPAAATAVGYGSAALFTYAHVLPTLLPGWQDSFTSGPRINVTWYSWLTAVAEIGTGLALGYVGQRAWQRDRKAS